MAVTEVCVQVLCSGLFTTYVWVIVVGAQLVQVQEGLVHALFKLQGTFKGLSSAAPLVPLWFLQNKRFTEIVRLY